jgi:hypothetical protein
VPSSTPGPQADRGPTAGRKCSHETRKPHHCFGFSPVLIWMGRWVSTLIRDMRSLSQQAGTSVALASARRVLTPSMPRPTAGRKEGVITCVSEQSNVRVNSGSSQEDVRCFGRDPCGHGPENSSCSQARPGPKPTGDKRRGAHGADQGDSKAESFSIAPVFSVLIDGFALSSAQSKGFQTWAPGLSRSLVDCSGMAVTVCTAGHSKICFSEWDRGGWAPPTRQSNVRSRAPRVTA